VPNAATKAGGAVGDGGGAAAAVAAAAAQQRRMKRRVVRMASYVESKQQKLNKRIAHDSAVCWAPPTGAAGCAVGCTAIHVAHCGSS
jgi:hypothetical protein